MTSALRPTVRLIEGGVHRDTRGVVRFLNKFDFSKIDRLYTIEPGAAEVLRGWVGHQRDWKWFSVIQGKFKLGVVTPDSWTAPTGREPVTEFLLTGESYQVLEVPPGHCTASMALTEGAILMVFSSGAIEDAATDDLRFPASQWRLTRNDQGL